MIQEKSKKVGKVGYFNSLTGYIIYNDEMIPFHIKDCLHLTDKDKLVNQLVEFDLEIANYGPVARNVELKNVLKKEEDN